MKRIYVTTALFVSTCAGQSFEVASIHPNTSSSTHSDYSVDGNAGARLTAENVSLMTLIQRAFGVPQYQVSGPDWLRDVKFNIHASLPAETPRQQMPVALQALLKERFLLGFHRDTKEQSVYVLTVGKGGSKMAATPDTNISSGTWQTRDQFKAQNENMAHFCEVLSRQLGRPVLDATGLGGAYDFMLDYDSQDSMSLFVAIESKMGLKLETKKAPVELLVIDRVEKSPTAN
jgi:uncharacterized protein (TIGR03435 family)